MNNKEIIPRELLPKEVILNPDDEETYERFYGGYDYPYVIYTYLKYIGNNCDMFLHANRSEEYKNFILTGVDDDSYDIGDFLTENLEINSQMFKKALIEAGEDDSYISIHEFMEEQNLVEQLNSAQELLEISIIVYFELKFKEIFEPFENDIEENNKKNNKKSNRKSNRKNNKHCKNNYSSDTPIKGLELFKDILNNIEIIKRIFKQVNSYSNIETLDITKENIDDLIKNVFMVKNEHIQNNK
ncbi:MAG: hypothetical protein LBM96_04390 [Methanobrevibacter sp.]|jgi:hypothetical protein|nr:hypothetical protein [Candidatus Methanoflexus mossambicus]